MKLILILSIICLLCFQCNAYIRVGSPITRKMNNVNRINARIGKVDGPEVEAEDSTMRIPFDGIMGGADNNNLFEKPLDYYDPLRNLEDVPGEDGSEEKINAIQQRIQDRVAQLKQTGKWEEEQEAYGRDPLRNQAIWVTMGQQLKSCKPYDSIGDLGLTYILVLGTTLVLGGYLISARNVLDDFIPWIIKTDFDEDFFKNLFNN
jgi:hypothetical protein